MREDGPVLHTRRFVLQRSHPVALDAEKRVSDPITQLQLSANWWANDAHRPRGYQKVMLGYYLSARLIEREMEKE